MLRTAPRMGIRREVYRIYVDSVAERAGISVEETIKLIDQIEARQKGQTANKPEALIAASG